MAKKLDVKKIKPFEAWAWIVNHRIDPTLIYPADFEPGKRYGARYEGTGYFRVRIVPVPPTKRKGGRGKKGVKRG